MPNFIRFKKKNNFRSLHSQVNVTFFCRLPDRRLLASLKVQNIHQLKLLLSCLTFLWNFSETGYERKLIIENGVLPLVTRTLLLDPGTPYSFDPLNVLRGKTIAVNEQSIGCVAV